MSADRDAHLAALGFDVDRQRLARAYKRRRTVLSGVRVLAYIAISVWLLTGFTFAVKSWAGAFGTGASQIALYAVGLYFLYWLPVIPLGVFGGLILERRYGLSTQRPRSWFADATKSLVIGLGFSVLGVEVLYSLLSSVPDHWWLYAWILGMLVGVAVTWLGPVVLAPLFYKFEPLADEALAARLHVLADRAGTKVVGVFRMVASAKTTRAFGGLSGLGNTRRIVLSDTLLNRYTADEVETVIAHELGHHVQRDMLWLLAGGAVASFVGVVAVDRILRAAVPALRLSSIADIAGLPLIALAIAAVSTLAAPALNALSRAREAKADAYAIRMTQKPDAFRSTLVKIHDQNLGVVDPHPLAELLFHDHPSGRRRVESVVDSRESL